jgi:two-component system, NarL family, response regulator NreC
MKVLLVDDHQTFRDSFGLALRHQASIEVVAAATHARELVPLLKDYSPDLIVADLMLDDSDGIAVARELRRQGVRVPIFILTAFSHDMFVRDALQAGVLGYALKAQPLVEIIDGLRQCARGQRYMFPRFGVAEQESDRLSRDDLDRLSRREREVFAQILQGRTTRDIAKSLCISIKTVQTHRNHINGKLNVHSTHELVRLEALKGVLLPSSSGGPKGPRG